ncbi:MAG: aldo/keto reductase [Anaerolineaceae bacterium]|nr:aldo/keto reductase [Anaerolineaceae bacterium]
MQYRKLGKTGYEVSAVSFGAWAIGGAWGSVDDKDSTAALYSALDNGINFFDTADVYGDGRSEKLLAQLKKDRKDDIIIATKTGRRLDPHVTEGYNAEKLMPFIDRSLKNLETDALDLVQLHCPPTGAYYNPELFDFMDSLVTSGKVKHYGVSVEKVEEALKSIEYPNVKTVQIIFNIFRQRPAELFFREALRREIGILARVPLSSGMLTGKMTKQTTFESDDHRLFNRFGEAFDRGETFSGVDYETGLQAVEEIRVLLPEGVSMAQFALRWILMFDAVTCTIPGAKRPSQVEDNAAAAELEALTDETMHAIRNIYEKNVFAQVHHRW